MDKDIRQIIGRAKRIKLTSSEKRNMFNVLDSVTLGAKSTSNKVMTKSRIHKSAHSITLNTKDKEAMWEKLENRTCGKPEESGNPFASWKFALLYVPAVASIVFVTFAYMEIYHSPLEAPALPVDQEVESDQEVEIIREKPNKSNNNLKTEDSSPKSQSEKPSEKTSLPVSNGKIDEPVKVRKATKKAVDSIKDQGESQKLQKVSGSSVEEGIKEDFRMRSVIKEDVASGSVIDQEVDD